METTDWKARARREAAAIIAEALPNTTTRDYETLVTLIGIGWLQGVNVGSHEALGLVEESFEEMRAALWAPF
jgi:hypothetical protein